MKKPTVYHFAACFAFWGFWLTTGIQRSWPSIVSAVLVIFGLMYAVYGGGWAVDIHNSYATRQRQPSEWKRLIVVALLVAALVALPYLVLQGFLYVQ